MTHGLETRDSEGIWAHHRGVATPCRIRLLGGFDVEVGGRAVPPAAWQPDASLLVKVLALEPTHHLLRADVFDRVWPLMPPHEADPLLKRALKDACRALLDGNAITVEGERLRLWPYGELTVDAHTFAARAKHAKVPEQRQQATALYRGDLLPDDELPGLAALRTRLRLMYLELMRDPASGTPAWVDLREPVFSASIERRATPSRRAWVATASATAGATRGSNTDGITWSGRRSSAMTAASAVAAACFIPSVTRVARTDMAPLKTPGNGPRRSTPCRRTGPGRRRHPRGPPRCCR